MTRCRYFLVLWMFASSFASVSLAAGRDDESNRDNAVLDEHAKAAPRSAPATPDAKLVFPIIGKYGGVVVRPHAVDQPRAGVKVVFDVTSGADPGNVNKGLERVARLLNLYGAAKLKASDLTITVVLHGEGTKSALNDAAYKARFTVDQNPNLPLIRELQRAGVETIVCGQALNYQGFSDTEVADAIPIAAAALTVLVHRQADGYAYVPVP